MPFPQLRSFLTAWTRRQRFEDGLDDELRCHLDAYTEDPADLFPALLRYSRHHATAFSASIRGRVV